MALDVGGVIGGCGGLEKSLRGSHALEPLHLPLPSSGWLMRILRSIVAPSATLVAFCDSKMTGCGGIRSQLICDELVWDKAIFLQQLAHQFKRRPFVPPSLDQHVEDHLGARTIWKSAPCEDCRGNLDNKRTRIDPEARRRILAWS